MQAQDRMEDLPMKQQPTTAQRRRNQAAQPRTGEGKYAEKTGSKWKQHLPGQAVPLPRLAPLKRARHSGRPGPRKIAPIQSMQHMMDRPLHQKVGWLAGRWIRRKKKALRTLFSWK